LTIRHLAHRIAHDFEGGTEGLLNFMNLGRETKLSFQMLTNKLNFNCTSHHLYIEELEQILDRTNRNISVAEYFAAKANAVVFQLPEFPESDMALLDVFMRANEELGDVSGAFRKAYADGNINNIEFAAISGEIDDVIAVLLEFKSAVKRVVR
jgi:hypothetical protein